MSPFSIDVAARLPGPESLRQRRMAAAERLDAETEVVLDTIAANAPLSVAASKLAVTAIADGVSPTGTALAALEEARRRVWASEDAKEGPRAFRERRPPTFRGS